jgi:hypothetical protein
MRHRRTRLWIAGASFGSLAVVWTILPSFALADDVLEDTVENTEAAVDEAVDTTIGVVDEAADDVAGGALVEATGEITAVPSGGSTSADGGGEDGATTGGHEPPKVGDTSRPAGGGAGGGGDARASRPPAEREAWVWEPVDRLRLYRSAELEQSVGPSAAVDAAVDTDPCRADPSLVCLGLLYGLGDYAKSITTVLGVLAMTGMGLVGLMAIALALATTGSGALVVARHRSPATGRVW